VTQAGATYTVSGHITLGSQPLAGVFLALVNEADEAAGRAYYGSTNATGYYSIAFPAANPAYILNASLFGYSFLTEIAGVTVTSPVILPFDNQIVDFTAWVNPQINGVTAGFASATQPTQTAIQTSAIPVGRQRRCLDPDRSGLDGFCGTSGRGH